MQINIRNGSLSLGSVYKLIFAGWVISWGVIMGTTFLLILLMSLLVGSTYVNGEEVQGRGALMMSFLPMIILLPVVIGMQALMFSGFLTLGVWLYRKFRPITVVNHDTVSTF